MFEQGCCFSFLFFLSLSFSSLLSPLLAPCFFSPFLPFLSPFFCLLLSLSHLYIIYPSSSPFSLPFVSLTSLSLFIHILPPVSPLVLSFSHTLLHPFPFSPFPPALSLPPLPSSSSVILLCFFFIYHRSC